MRAYKRRCNCGICNLCLNRRDVAKYRRLHLERARESSRISRTRQRYGGYQKKDYCEVCRKRNLAGKYKLLIHHVQWEDCRDCRRRGRNIDARCRRHLVTICYPCHSEIHIQPVTRELMRDGKGRWTKRERMESSREDSYLAAKLI